VTVDYTDPNRIENTLLRSNVKVIDPNTTIIYSCPVMLPGRDETTSVFVAPRGLGIRAGDVLCSAQAGGVMHKVNLTSNTGKFSFFGINVQLWFIYIPIKIDIIQENLSDLAGYFGILVPGRSDYDQILKKKVQQPRT